jgi:hypothetical protein
MPVNVKEDGVPWSPGIRRNIPWLALTGILGFVLCCIGLALVLWSSNGKEVSSWPSTSTSGTISVSAVLSLLVSIANICLATALDSGYEIAWWNKALRGAELGRLHFDLGIRRDFTTLLSREVGFDRFLVAAVVALIVGIADGPVIQLASTSPARTFGPLSNVTGVNVGNASFPADFSAYSGGGTAPQILTPVFSNVSRAYSSRDDIHLPVDGCATNTTCTFTLPAPGFDVSCTDQHIAYDFDELAAAGKGDAITNPAGQGGANNQITTFNVNITFGENNAADSFGKINTVALFKGDAACAGKLTKRSCVLRLATVGYPVTLSNGIATMQPWQMGHNESLSLYQFNSSSTGELFTGGIVGNFRSMLGGIFFVLNDLYSSHMALRIAVMTFGFLFDVNGQAASNYLTSDLFTYGLCNMTWEDPTVDMVNTARELMLRSAIAYSNTTAPTPQQLLVQRTTISSAYQSHWEYLGITIAIMLVQALIIVWFLSGWRHLGGEMTLDEFEIAKAMGTPLLQEGSSNADVHEALASMRHVRLRYGEILPEGTKPPAYGAGERTTTQRAGEDSDALEMEQLVGRDFSPLRSEEGSQQRRLGLNREDRVKTPLLGALY